MVNSIYVEKKEGYDNEAKATLLEINEFLHISGVKKVRVVNRYDIEGIDRALFNSAVSLVLSESRLDDTSEVLDISGASGVFGVEYLPGQFDQRADSASQCIAIISGGGRPAVMTAKIYLLYGDVTKSDTEKIKNYFINPVECREATLETLTTLKAEEPAPEEIQVAAGFTSLDGEGISAFIKDFSLAMDKDDLILCRNYFASENRDPTFTEIKIIDTYWSDHCRHTTFLTAIEKVSFESEELENSYNRYLALRKSMGATNPVCLMDIATIAAKHFKQTGKLTNLDESDEINACTVKIKVNVDGKDEDYLLLFKNETHNHPTEIEPFGGAATCIGGAIRDPLSGRAYVYAAMRVTGAGDPLSPAEDTLPGKLPQRKITATAAAGYSSYGNQVGVATGQVKEFYHPGYVAKRMEIGGVIGAVPAENVRREKPSPGDVVILVGGRTGRDGCGGATGSSKSHDQKSLAKSGAEVQKGNAPEERKLQRLFRNKNASLLIKRCNDFGAGGVSVAIGELADGLDIDLDKIKKKYSGLDGTELAISESQERMAVVVSKQNEEMFIRLAESENLEAAAVAEVTDKARLVMRWKNRVIADISREFLNTNGAKKKSSALLSSPLPYEKPQAQSFEEALLNLAADYNSCSGKGLAERFDSTIGASTVLMPFGGKTQSIPIMAMVHKIPLQKGETDTCSFMSYGFNPFISEKSPYHGAYNAVVESVSKIIAAGGDRKSIHLSFQEYFEKLRDDDSRWGKPMSSLLGALDAQLDLGAAAIGGKDSMSGTFEDIDVPPTLVSFGVAVGSAKNVVSPEFKEPGHAVVWFRPEYGKNRLPIPASFIENCDKVAAIIQKGMAHAVFTPAGGGAAEGVLKSCLGNDISFEYDGNITLDEIFGYSYGSFVVEMDKYPGEGVMLGKTRAEGGVSYGSTRIPLQKLREVYEGVFENLFPTKTKAFGEAPKAFTFINKSPIKPGVRYALPRALIPVFPGTNCEYDTEKSLLNAGAAPQVFVLNNLTPAGIKESAENFAKCIGNSQIIVIPGGFSGGDEPDGSGKFITAFFRNPYISEKITEFLEKRDGLMCGICNGFQALIKLGLVPYGRITPPRASSSTLAYNAIGRHQSQIVRVRVSSNKSPWFANTSPGEVYLVPISHGEGRFVGDMAEVALLGENGQIAAQYVDFDGNPSRETDFNPNGSFMAVEAVTSPDGRVLGKMGHSERTGRHLYKNVPGNYDMDIFGAAVKYYE